MTMYNGTAEGGAPQITAIAVMGVTGSGKSNFIRSVMGQDHKNAPEVGHDLASCTSETKPYECLIDGRQFIIFDTPGFDDTFTGDADILANVAESLSASYKSQLKLTGIVYLHRIKDEKMTNAIMRNLSMFKNLCGDGSLKNTILATTFWDELPSEDKGRHREEQLAQKREYWGYMTSKGAKMRRFMNTRESALEIIFELAQKTSHYPSNPRRNGQPGTKHQPDKGRRGPQRRTCRADEETRRSIAESAHRDGSRNPRSRRRATRNALPDAEGERRSTQPTHQRAGSDAGGPARRTPAYHAAVQRPDPPSGK